MRCGLSSCRFNRHEPAISDGFSDDIDATVCGIGDRLGRLLMMEFEVPEVCPILVRSFYRDVAQSGKSVRLITERS